MEDNIGSWSEGRGAGTVPHAPSWHCHWQCMACKWRMQCSDNSTAVCAARSALGAVRGLVKRRTMHLGLRFYASAGFNNQVMITYFSNVYVIITYVHIFSRVQSKYIFNGSSGNAQSISRE